MEVKISLQPKRSNAELDTKPQADETIGKGNHAAALKVINNSPN